MALTPQDIQSQQFHVRFRGFDVDEVDEFLEKVAEDYLTAIQENKHLKERLEEMQKDLATYRDQEKSFQKAFLSAQQVAEEMKEKSQKEAEEIVEQAKEEVEQLRSGAQEEVAGLLSQLDQLRNQKNEIREELRATLTGYLDRLNESFDTATVDSGAATSAPSPDAEEEQAEEPEGTLQEDFASDEETKEDEVMFETETVEIAESSYAPEEPDEAEKEKEDPFFQNLAATEEDDLYEKVDLTDDFRLPEEDDLPGYGKGEASIFSMQEQDGTEDAMPDLEGEMVFSLDDPLDDLTPDIKIQNEEAAKE